MLKCKGPKPFLQGLKVLKEPCFQLKNTISVAQCLLFLTITRTKQVILSQHVRRAQSPLPNGWGDEKKMQISELGRVHGEQNM